MASLIRIKNELKILIRKALLPVAVLAIAFMGCASQPNGDTATLSTVTIGPPQASTATPEPSSTATPIPTASAVSFTPALPVLAAPALVQIDFQDANNGWGIAANAHGSVLRTVDGGSTWWNATPAQTGPIGPSAALTVLDNEHAWVLVPGTDFFSGTLYRTGDGGINWNSNTVPFSGAFIQFLDASHGRALAERGAGAGSEAVELFQTSDGGATWTSIFHDDPGLPGSSDSLPLPGIKNGMTFLDANTGWVTGSIQADGPADGQVYLYITRDGGVSWSKQSLPLTTGYENYQYIPQAPVFFGKDGFLPLTISRPEAVDLTFYTSQDGGLTWSGDPADAGRMVEPGLPAFADGLHAWVWDGGADLYSSIDGAQTWAIANPSLNLSGNLARLEFVPGFTGWALTRLDEAGHSQLYRTNDGVHWTPLIP